MLFTVALATTIALGCKKAKPPTPEESVGDAFVDHYLKADQDGALPFTALTAKAQLEKELADVKIARLDGAPESHATWKRGSEEARDKRTVIHYDVTLDDAPKRDLRIEITDLGQGPKVVLYELK